MRGKIINNIQLYQTGVLSMILFIGVEFFGLDISYAEIGMTFFTVILLDFLYINFIQEKKAESSLLFPYSGVNAGFGISFFLRSGDIALYFLAAFIAITSKYLFSIKGKHFLNPSNFGVLSILFLFPNYSWVNTLQWGTYTGAFGIQYLIMIVFVFLLGSFMMFQVKKNFGYRYYFDYLLPFLLLHFLLFFIIPFEESWTSFFRFFNISFFIFTFFMISDPKTVPVTSLGRVGYAFSIVLIFYLLQFFINESYAILASLFCNTIFLHVIWFLEKSRKKIIFFYSILYTLIISCILVQINLRGRPDLLFDNICTQLFCK